MNTLTQEALASSNTPAHLYQANLIPAGDPNSYDPYATAVATANSVKNGTQDALNTFAASGGTTGSPAGAMTKQGGNTFVDGGGVSKSDWSDIGWPWGDTTEQFPVTAFGIGGLSGIMDDAKAFATKPIFGFPLWAVASLAVGAAVATGVMKNPLKKYF